MNYWNYFDYCIRYYWKAYGLASIVLALFDIGITWCESGNNIDEAKSVKCKRNNRT